MKKGLKIIIGILLVIVIGIGGIGYMQHKEHEKMVAIATSEEAKKVYEEYLRMEEPAALTKEGKIRTYEVELEELGYNPMGGLMTKIYINNDKKKTMSFNLIDNEDGTYSTAYYILSGELSTFLEE
ncbi:DUF1310 family protein [Streptococcus suis]|uniref:DUF1310 family protein n=1 Tax=Streptococcus suis TaxID=1307 RepID=UPI0004024FB5|nr:DUF1310 family protein [Streptococcus suis]